MTTEKPTPDIQSTSSQPAKDPQSESEVKEINGPKGPEPTRYGDWEHNGRCIDF